MIGWIAFQEDESWHEHGSKMARKLAMALSLFPIDVWSKTLSNAKQTIIDNFDELPMLTQLAMKWDIEQCGPLNACCPKRKPGRPRIRWQ